MSDEDFDYEGQQQPTNVKERKMENHNLVEDKEQPLAISTPIDFSGYLFFNLCSDVSVEAALPPLPYYHATDQDEDKLLPDFMADAEYLYICPDGSTIITNQPHCPGENEVRIVFVLPRFSHQFNTFRSTVALSYYSSEKMTLWFYLVPTGLYRKSRPLRLQ